MEGIGLPKDIRYEELLERVNEELAGSAAAGEEGAEPTAPLVIVAGVPRSGTTLLYQLLAGSGAFVYPSNLIARFYGRPVAGWRIERLLEPLLPARGTAFRSAAGRTEAWWGPHELGYFRHASLPFEAHHQPSAETLAAWDHRPMARKLAALQAEDGRPLVVKNPVLGYVLETLLERLPAARIVWVERSPLEVACSLYRTRITEVGEPGRWWSVRPAAVETLERLAPEEQIAAQIRSLAEAAERARSRYSARWLDLTHPEICSDPRAAIAHAAAFAGLDPIEDLPDLEPFERSPYGVEPEVLERLRRALGSVGLRTDEED